MLIYNLKFAANSVDIVTNKYFYKWSKMKKLLKLAKYYLLASIFLIPAAFGQNTLAPKIFSKVEKAVVVIDTRISVSAYGTLGSFKGTGFITDKEHGLIVTNNHMIGGGSAIGTYLVTFHNGQQVQARPIYYDLWQDYAILKIDPLEIPGSAEQIILSKNLATANQSVFVIGGAECQAFSYHSGHISSLYDINGSMPQCSYIVNLNSAGGSSGSPLLNDKGEALGIVYGGSKTYAIALHGHYIHSALEQIKKSKIPQRRHVGIISALYSLDYAVKHRNFPLPVMQEYIKKFPDAKNKVVVVSSAVKGSPAEAITQPGDIIWAVDDQLLGGSLAVFDAIMDKATGDSVQLTIYRNGKKMQLATNLYDVNSHKIDQMVSFAGATFCEADDFSSVVCGIPSGSLMVREVQAGSSFSNFSSADLPIYFSENNRTRYRLVVKSVNEHNIGSLKELISIIPGLTKQKFISMRLKNYMPYFTPYNSALISTQQELIADILFDNVDDKPRVFKYLQASNEWVAEDIGANVQ